MTPLACLQRDLQASILDGTTAGRVHVAGRTDDERLARLGVYRHAYGARLAEVLANDFPALLAHLGSDHFGRLASGYVASRRSVHRNVRWYGGEFPSYVKIAHDAIASDLARLEWILGRAFDAPDAALLQHADLMGIPAERWAGARFVLHPSAQRADLSAAAVPAWRRARLGEPAASDGVGGTAALLVWRKEHEPYFRVLAADEAWAVDATLGRAAFADVCEGLCRWHTPEDAPTRAATLLGNWITDALVAWVEY